MRNVKHIRIDDRLIHGQIVHAWLSATGATTIVVADDKAAEDEFQKCLLKMAVPPKIKLKVLSVQAAAAWLSDESVAGGDVLLILRNAQSALDLANAGFVPERINVGNVSAAPGRVQYSKSVFLDEMERYRFESLREKGISLEIQVVPGERKEDLFHLLDRLS